jgi:ABC-2 type transport system permease protein
MKALAGTGTLARLALRRDRIRLLVWGAIIVGLVAVTASSVTSLYATAAKRQQYTESVGASPASAVLGGPGLGLPHLGGIVIAESSTMCLVIIALLSTMLVVRHTRAEEESGRAELVAAAVVGRHARLSAALVAAFAIDLAIGIGLALALIGYGLPATGSVALALAIAGTGAVFASIAAVTAQLSEHSRTANGAAAAVLGLAFILRAIGDASGVSNPGAPLRNLSWASPLGWAHRVRAYDGERWWLLGVMLAACLALIMVAALLSTHRDVAAGLVPARLGRATAASGLRSAWALAWRLQRGALIGWTVGLAVAAGVFGSIAHDVDSIIGNNAEAAKIFAELGGSGALINSYLTWVFGLAGVATAGYAVMAVLRSRSEENALRAEPVLATAVKRWQWLASHVAVAITGAVILLVTAGLVVGVVHGIRSGRVAHEVPRMLSAGLIQVPAALVLAAFAVALFGLLPRLVTAAWVFVVGVLLIGQLGGIVGLNRWVQDISPFTHVPRVGAAVTALPLLWLSAITMLLAALGFVGFRRRDVGVV